MKVDDLILDLQNLIDNAKSVPLSGGKVMVNSDEVFEIIAQIQDAMPAEVRQAKNILADRKQILNKANVDDAKAKSAEIRKAANVYADGILKRAEESLSTQLTDIKKTRATLANSQKR